MGSRARPLLAIDAETDPFAFGTVPRAFLWGSFDGRDYRYWWEDAQGFAQHLFTDRRWLAYAHNGGRFDYHLLAEHVPEGARVKLVGGRIASLVDPGRTELRDSMLIAPTGLGKLGDKLGIDYHKHARGARDRHRDEILRYHAQDCETLYEVIDRWVTRFGRRHLTVAGAALAELRRIQPEVRLERTRIEFDTAFRGYYFGGRCDAPRPGVVTAPLRLYDLNSAYPAAMRAEHPWGHSIAVSRTIPEDPGRRSRAFYRITASSRRALPVRPRDGSPTRYPWAEGEYWLTGWELDAGLDTDTLRVLEVHSVTELCDLVSFAPFVDHWYRERKLAEHQGDAAGAVFAKTILNSLYGKLAQDARRVMEYQLAGAARIAQLHDDDWIQRGAFGPHAILSRSRSTRWAPYLNVATAASVTGYVRAQLWRAWCVSRSPLYCDTDSLLCLDLPGADVGDGLGQWSVETFNLAAIVGRKLYALRRPDGSWKTAAKGVQLTPNQIVDAAYGRSVTSRSDAPSFGFGRAPIFIERRVTAKRGH